ncbi:MAG: sigma 54-interacting transcriptional regulator, partial [Acidobacteriota bacterium]|nr:sigma 54-interacting transcriptional regulator [Acidobacteriota bacterium]
LRLTAGEETLFEQLRKRELTSELFGGEDASRWWEWLFSLGGALAGHAAQVSAILTDPITGLPDRTGFQAILSEAMQKSRIDQERFALLLVNPDDFASVNENLGRPQGDAIIRQIGDGLRSVLRASDPVARYGGVIFAVVLPATTRDWAEGVGKKVLQRLSGTAYLEETVRLAFSIGFALYDPKLDGTMLPVELFRQADQALNAAKRRGGGRVVEWHEEISREEAGACDKLTGIFTGNVSKDYRNMVLLWDTIDVIARSQDFDHLAEEVVDRLTPGLRLSRIGLFIQGADGEPVLKKGRSRLTMADGERQLVKTLEPSEAELALLAEAVTESSAVEAELGGEVTGHAVPLLVGGEALGILFLAGENSQLVLDESDFIFLRALAGQIAAALDRARLSELESDRKEKERQELQAQIHELRHAMRRAKLVYQSAEMEAVLERARRVAPTDATVLVTGESGTGKELLARTVHELSPRRRKALVVVDCVAIATTLMESELFGHEKGAYTGAQGRRIGRLAEADGGTVLLDEIGELPLEVQSKLLRFVQDKQYTPVGGSRPKQVDVRILAATNRDLATEVTKGRFREDLYYRLNVVSLEVPPLRARRTDILHLARYFLETFSMQYQKPVRRFTEQAEVDMHMYDWPGNIRELQNRIMQAVILCEQEEIGPEELQLDSMLHPRQASVPSPPDPADSPLREAPPAPDASLSSPEKRLRSALREEIDLALSDESAVVYPLGRWLREDLVLEANALAKGVARRGAELLGIPETTFRRRFAKADEQVRAGLSPRSGRWEEVRSILRQLVDPSGSQAGREPLKEASRILLEEILHRVPGDTSKGSKLLAVTAPTFRTRVAELEEDLARQKSANAHDSS